jgi:DNA-binding transcriptional MerR regulator
MEPTMDVNVVSAFTAEQVERLTGLTKSQLRYWDRTGFFRPTYVDAGRRVYGRIYSFRDVVGLKTLGILRNANKVPLQHLREVAKSLSHLKDAI